MEPNIGTGCNKHCKPSLCFNGSKKFYHGQLYFPINGYRRKGATGVDSVSITVNPGQQTLTLQPDNNPYEYQVTNLNGQDASGTGPEISIDAWTSGGFPWTLREIFRFDLNTIPSTTESQLDLNIDVKNIVTSMISNNANYGFFLRLENEVTYNSRIFISSYNTAYPGKHPKLVVVYK